MHVVEGGDYNPLLDVFLFVVAVFNESFEVNRVAQLGLNRHVFTIGHHIRKLPQLNLIYHAQIVLIEEIKPVCDVEEGLLSCAGFATS